MKAKILLLTFTFLTILFINSAFSIVPLCPSDCYKLKPEALEHYNKALEHLDRVYIIGALEELREATKADPDHVNLHFLLARIARERGKMETSLETAQKYYTIAENALSVIQKRENLSKDQQEYLLSALEQVEKEKASLVQRNQRRLEVGHSIIMDYMKDIGRLEIEKPKEETTASPAESASVPGSAISSSSPFGASPISSSPFGSFLSSSPLGTSPAAPSAPGASASPFGVTEPATASTPGAASPFGVTEPATAPAPGAASPFGVTSSPAPAAPVSPPEAPENPFASF